MTGLRPSVSMILAAVSLLAVSPARVSRAENAGSLVTWSGPPVLDIELAYLIDKHFEDGSPGSGQVASDILLVNTQCYGGNTRDNFDSVADNGRPIFGDTTWLSATTDGQLARYGGYDADAAAALVPGATAGDVHDAGVAGKDPSEDPRTLGDLGKEVGGESSTHVLIWAGQPNEQDVEMILDIVQSFDGLPNTSVTLLAADGPGGARFAEARLAGVTGGPATYAGLENALEDIGEQMDDGPNEQFIMFITDHGNVEVYDPVPAPVPPGEEVVVGVPVEHGVLRDWLLGAGNLPTLTVYSRTQLPDPGKFEVFLNDHLIETIGRCDEAWFVRDLESGDSEVVAYTFHLDPAGSRFLLDDLSTSAALRQAADEPAPYRPIDQRVRVVNKSPTTTADFSHVMLGSGDMPKRGTSCTNSVAGLCLGQADRFEVTASYRTQSGREGIGRAVSLTNDTGYFWFFDDANVELVVKVLDACSFDDAFWVFAGGLTNVEVVLTVRDMLSGAVKTYLNPQRTTFLPLQDTDGFATCGTAAVATELVVD